ncbi:TAXI family TRAP transporter solute-binding subunit [Rhodopseudomonas pseudopalustris]|uniref:TRAP transporter solute receptor, TAXI family n=1 Tax=Rhodopseudomonas pseudopalustris TaxID=1513892 RepID=A0A1H8Q980_9BRAD|nr:TAXI family TRAP transporter solute-binding subunit [Rhodopseudomonas pseudopalustris]SEO50323.1 TRAP transporter solute receptor, TAXI family [Rhodopseudomonas pseudopalustris]
MIRRFGPLATIAISCAVFVTTGAAADEPKLPSTMTFTAYDTGTAGFNIAVAIGKMMKDKHSTDVRVLPAGNDVARLAPLRAGRAQMAWMGSGTYFAQEGVFEFGAKEWGPQSLQISLSVVDCSATSLGVAKDAGVKEIKDLRGKRVGFVVGSPAVNQNTLGIIAYGGLTQKDVKIIEFASYGAMWKGLINNDVDATFGTTITGPAKEVENSPRGLMWPPMPHADKAAWERVMKVAPFFKPHVSTCGAAHEPGKPIELSHYPYPIATVYGSQPADQVYAITKSMIVNYDTYKDSAPGAAGLAVKTQTMKWVVPFHPGAVKALQEAGQWSPEDQTHNDGLIRRQGVLAAAWKTYVGSAPSGDKEFLDGWMAARAAALKKEAMPNGFEQ